MKTKSTVNYNKLALAIITEWDSDRIESGDKEIANGMFHILNKYTSEHDRELIDDMLMTFTGWKLDTLLQQAEQISDDAVEDQ